MKADYIQAPLAFSSNFSLIIKGVIIKNANDLIAGDNIKIGGLMCTITKVEFVFHQMPKNRIRISLKIIGATTKKDAVILFLPPGTPIETLK